MDGDNISGGSGNDDGSLFITQIIWTEATSFGCFLSIWRQWIEDEGMRTCSALYTKTTRFVCYFFYSLHMHRHDNQRKKNQNIKKIKLTAGMEWNERKKYPPTTTTTTYYVHKCGAVKKCIPIHIEARWVCVKQCRLKR